MLADTQETNTAPGYARQVGEHTLAARLARAAAHDEIAAVARERADWLRRMAGWDSSIVPNWAMADSTLNALGFEALAGMLERCDAATTAGREARGEALAELASRSAGYRDHHAERSALFSLATWHERRGRGERARIEKVESCQTQGYVRQCPDCGTVDGVEVLLERCQSWRYCVACRGAHCAEFRERFDESAKQMRAVYAYELARPWRRWSEKMHTLTVPHSGSAPKDFALLIHAWRRYSRRIREWLASRDTRVKHYGMPLPYLRVMELTGSDAGHAHMHCWWLSPFLPHWVARVEWGKSLAYSDVVYVPVKHIDDAIAECSLPGPVCEVVQVLERGRLVLERCSHASCKQLRRHNERAERELRELAVVGHGRRIQWLPWPVVDVREADTGVGSELVKYLTKDLGPTGAKVDPFEYAQLVEATEQRRMICSSLGFWLALPPVVCECCERSYLRVPVVGARLAPGGPRGPPLQYIQEA